MDCNIIIKKFIVHILDNNIHIPVLSDHQHDTDYEVEEYIINHITRVLKGDDIKTAYFSGESNDIRSICERIKDSDDDFVKSTCSMADKLYKIMQQHPDIPAADLLCLLFTLDGVQYFGMLKLNYRCSYIHNVRNIQDGRVNSIIMQKTALPADGQKVDECILINLGDYSIKIVEKKFDIDGEKDFYLSTAFLGSVSQPSDREKVRALRKANRDFNKKYYGEDITKAPDIDRAIAESIEKKSAIDIVDVADDVFKRSPDMKEAYIQQVKKAGINDRTIHINPALTGKAFARHKIKTDTGIEINLPVNLYNDKEKIEFAGNPDGTISIILKNITSITDI